MYFDPLILKQSAGIKKKIIEKLMTEDNTFYDVPELMGPYIV